MMNKMSIKKDDTVVVITGKDKGQRQQAQCERLYMFHDFLPFFFAKNAS